MALSNYTDISGAVAKWLNREGFSDITSNVEDFITMAQRRIMRDVRIPAMEQVTTLTAASSVAVPTDLLEVRDMVLKTSNYNVHLERTTWDHTSLYTTTGVPTVFSRAGGNFYFGPIPDSGYDIDLFYYREIAFISSTNATNWFSRYAPELILTGAILEALIFLKDDARIPVYEQKFFREKSLLEQQAGVDEYSSNSRVHDETNKLYGAP